MFSIEISVKYINIEEFKNIYTDISNKIFKHY